MKKNILFLSMLFLLPVLVQANEKIVQVDSVGRIELTNGQTVQLAGISLPEEAVVLLSVLLTGKNCDIKEAKEISSVVGSNGPMHVYMYIETSDLLIQKETANKNAREKRMVNEFLLSLGSARTNLSVPFKYQEEFVEIENQARETGQGVWSYELPAIQETQKIKA